MVFDWFRRQKKTEPEEQPQKKREEEASPASSSSSRSPTSSPKTSSLQASEPSSSEAASPPAATEDYLAFAKAAYANLKAQQATKAPLTPAETTVVESKASAKPATPPVLPDLPAEQKVPDGDSADFISATITAPPSVMPVSESEPPSKPAIAIAEFDQPAAPETPLTEVPSTAAIEVGAEQQAVLETPDVTVESEPAVVSVEAEVATDEVEALLASEATTVEPPLAEPPLNVPAEPSTSHLTELAEAATVSPEPAAPKAFFEMAPKASERLEVLEAEAIEEPEPEEPVQGATTALEAAAQTFVPDFDDGFVWSTEVLAAQGRRVDEITVEEITWLQKLRRGLGKTRLSLINQLKSLVGKGPINDEAVEEIESLLLQADVGIAATDQIVEALQSRMRDEVLPPDEAVAYLKQLLREILSVGEPNFAPTEDSLNIWLMVGVNGAGKTTTLGKIAHLAKKSDYRVLVAAGDTFRAAAVEQVQEWGERAGVEVIANPGKNTDPAAIVFDAIAAAQSRNTELLLVDTAGRLQNKKNLMDELSKIRRIVDKKAPNAKVESLLVLDATLGQNGLRQAQVFSEAADLSGVVLTKLDGTAKGGVALAVAKEMQLPIRFIGVGEGLEDLRPFSSYEFVEALVSEY
ncbi:MAG: signal recognition particle-docking protein FtsY [Synechococcus sp.]